VTGATDMPITTIQSSNLLCRSIARAPSDTQTAKCGEGFLGGLGLGGPRHQCQRRAASLRSLGTKAPTDARKFNSPPSRRRRMLSAGALSAGSTNPRSQGRRRGFASRFGCTAGPRSSVPPRPPARRDVYEWPKSDILRSQGGLAVAYLRLIA
jgi:hypothetical protein